ncbi:hypothetical protein E4U42_004617 [Claviceps africana]|uniref:Uncharacterized protein n=1 Tax=Claviceps africana TaxID=83212 RepID=A0A8K0NG31_9HYPO|nr:hypothetical protein E4U42_004617 [Claviceps africana]
MDRSSHASPPSPLNLASPTPNKCKLDRSNTADSSISDSKRSGSRSSSSFSLNSSMPFPSLRKTSPAAGLIKSSPTVNVHTTCGRHTDQLLFGGPSLKDLARSIKKKL